MKTEEYPCPQDIINEKQTLLAKDQSLATKYTQLKNKLEELQVNIAWKALAWYQFDANFEGL